MLFRPRESNKCFKAFSATIGWFFIFSARTSPVNDRSWRSHARIIYTVKSLPTDTSKLRKIFLRDFFDSFYRIFGKWFYDNLRFLFFFSKHFLQINVCLEKCNHQTSLHALSCFLPGTNSSSDFSKFPAIIFPKNWEKSTTQKHEIV